MVSDIIQIELYIHIHSMQTGREKQPVEVVCAWISGTTVELYSWMKQN